ncbi:unnamed protein product [Citrullus colocynthis]|uniref:Uncharacterized protein n=1 Tax=Citrullus colocynthis TaxID=252529 RepID=A0ABP0Z0S4_9ROSI
MPSSTLATKVVALAIADRRGMPHNLLHSLDRVLFGLFSLDPSGNQPSEATKFIADRCSSSGQARGVRIFPGFCLISSSSFVFAPFLEFCC